MDAVHIANAIQASETGKAMPRLDVMTILRAAFDVVIQLRATGDTDKTGRQTSGISEISS